MPTTTADAPITFRHHVLESDPALVRQLAESTGFFRPDEVDVAVELVEERLQKGEPSGYEFVFAESQGQAAGYACYGPIACTIGSFDLYWIVVGQAHQRRGIGQLLLEESECQIRRRSGRNVYVETSSRPQYAPTRAFYERCRYRIEATLENFYDVGDDKVILVKTLAKLTNPLNA